MFKGTVYLTISSFVFLLSGYITNFYLGRALGPELYGIYGIVITIISLVNVTLATGFTQSVSKHISSDKLQAEAILKTALYFQITASIAVALLLFFIAKPLSLLLGDLDLVHYIQLSALIIPLYGLYSLYIDYYNGLHRFSRQAIISIIYSISKIVTIVILAIIFKLQGAIVGFIIAPLLAIFFGFKFPQNSTSFYPLKKLFLFSVPLVAYSIFSNIQLSIDIFMVKTFVKDNAEVGYYAAAQNISRIIFYSLSAFSLVLLPNISSLIHSNDSIRLERIIRSTIRYIVICISPLIIILTSQSLQVTEFIYSASYRNAATPLSILTVGITFFTIFTILVSIINGLGKPKLSLVISLISVIVTIAGSIMLTPSLKLIGAALSMSIGSFTAMLLAGYYLISQYKGIIPFISLIRTVSISSVIYLFSVNIDTSAFTLPLLIIGIFSVYIIALIITKEITNKDLNIVYEILPAKLSSKFRK